MTRPAQAYTLKTEELPDMLPVFPLTGVLLLPQGMLPLNIFEPRYIDMFNDALASNRLIGIIQPRPQSDLKSGLAPLQRVGCAGRIVQFSETPDGRYLVTLAGLWRFAVNEELPRDKPYRRARVSWQDFAADLDGPDALDLDRPRLKELAKIYFAQHDIQVDCAQFEGAPDAKLINALSMICPFEPMDKQALLEAPCSRTRARMFMTMLEIAAHATLCESCH